MPPLSSSSLLHSTKTTLTLLLGLAACAQVAIAQNAAPQEENREQRDTRMAWWREAKFGMFIHWGVYSVPAGYYQDKPVPGIGEWIMNHGRIPMADYQAFAKQFDPVKFDADAWVKIAKDAGMKYIVITSKHHDGFAMFCSAASKWNICDATPYGRDPLRDLAAACRKQGIKLGFYYSQAQDWNNGGAAAGGAWDPAQTHDMDDYIDRIAVPQVREILTNYGADTPAVLWWDTPVNMNHARAQKLHDAVEQLKPNIIMNNRLGGGFKGDTETPEQHIPAQGYPGEDWETCMTMNDTWGFRRDDNNWKSTKSLIRNLCDIASKGGNYLLNVGPTCEGVFPQASIDRLAEIGKWMRVNGDVIYGTGPTPFGAEAGANGATGQAGKGHAKFVEAWDWRCTTKPGKVYIHLFTWPSNGKFVVPMTNEATKAVLLADPGKKLETSHSDAGLTITLPAGAPDPIASVVAVDIDGPPRPIASALAPVAP